MAKISRRRLLKGRPLLERLARQQRYVRTRARQRYAALEVQKEHDRPMKPYIGAQLRASTAAPRSPAQPSMLASSTCPASCMQCRRRLDHCEGSH